MLKSKSKPNGRSLNGISALMIATLFGLDDIAKGLSENGALLEDDAKDKWDTALFSKQMHDDKMETGGTDQRESQTSTRGHVSCKASMPATETSLHSPYGQSVC